MTPLAACPICGTARPADRAGDWPWCCSITCYRAFHRLEEPAPQSPLDVVTTAPSGQSLTVRRA